MQMKRILKNYRRKRREPCAIELGNALSFHLKFLQIPSDGKFNNSKIRDKKVEKLQKLKFLALTNYVKVLFITNSRFEMQMKRILRIIVASDVNITQ